MSQPFLENIKEGWAQPRHEPTLTVAKIILYSLVLIILFCVWSKQLSFIWRAQLKLPARTNYPSQPIWWNISRALISHGACERAIIVIGHPFTFYSSPGQNVTSGDNYHIIAELGRCSGQQYTLGCHLWQVQLLRRWFTSSLTLSLANGRAGLGGIIQSGGRDTGSGLTDILNVSKYYRHEVRTSGRLLHWYLVTGALTSLRIFAILKNMLYPMAGDMFCDNFTLSLSFLDGFPVHVWVSHAGHRREQMWAQPAPATGVTMTSRDSRLVTVTQRHNLSSHNLVTNNLLND